MRELKEIEKSLQKKYRKEIFSKFIRAVKDFNLVEENDIIQIDIEQRILAIIGINGELKTPEEIDVILKERKSKWHPKPSKYKDGILSIYTQLASSPMTGGRMVFNKKEK